MRLSDLAGPSLSSWIVALAALGVLALSPSHPAHDVAHIARPPAADVSVSTPAMRSAAGERTRDMLPFAYDLDEPDRAAGDRLPALVDAGS